MDYVAVKKSLSCASVKPRYFRLAEAIQDCIESGSLKRSDKIPSQRELMTNLGLSDSTVNRAIRELEARGIVYSRQGQGTFVADKVKSQATTIVALVPSRPNVSYDTEIVWHAEQAAHRGGYELMVCNTEDNFSKVDTYLDRLLSKDANMILGVLYVPVATNCDDYYERNMERIARIQRLGIKVVLCDRNFLNQPDAIAAYKLDAVYSDDMRGSRAVVEHFISLGRRRIALLSGPMDSNVENRITGYRQALHDNGLSYMSELVKFVDSYERPEDVAPMVDELLATPDGIDAIFAINDRAAEAVLECLQSRGVCVPDDVSLSGYDNMEHSRYLSIPLTTVDRANGEIGEKAVELLLEQVENPRNYPRHIALPTQLIIRQSSCSSEQLAEMKA
ncbi:MAG TPA: GntR family transcriptional regulator [Phycisphaerae bacterium]|nr:GntR family transcriptional regulator [Phycisphaerae bacterium]